jgi:hypothetical protein
MYFPSSIDEADPLVKQSLEAADTDSLYASVLTFGEIRLGVELLPPSMRRMQLEQWLDRTCLNGLKAAFYRSIGKAWPRPTIGPVPEVRKVSGIGSSGGRTVRVTENHGPGN